MALDLDHSIYAGWTHACGSGKSIANIVSGLAPEVDFAFVGLPQREIRSVGSARVEGAAG